MTTALVLEQLDPAALLADQNIRTARPDKGLIESVRTHGVLQPIVGYRTEGGHVRIRYGHRRTLAAIDAGLDAVPVLVLAAEADAGDIDRILRQYDENTHRADLTAADQAGVVVQLLDLGLTADQVRTRTRLPRNAVAAARAVAGSVAARRAAAKDTALTLDQAAAIAEFGGDPDAVKRLTAAAHEGPGMFAHTAQKLRDEAESQRQRAATVATLTADGITIVEEGPGWENRLTLLMDEQGAELTARNHKACPGHVATVVARWGQKGQVWIPEYYCADPKANGHRKLRSATGGQQTAEQQAEERRRVIAGNKAWRAAEKVRRAWLKDSLLASRTPPDGAWGFIAEALATDGHRTIQRGLNGTQPMAHQLLGAEVPAGTSWGPATAIAGQLRTASDQRAAVITLAMIVGCYEDAASTETWRTPKAYPSTARYFTALASWGYELAETEQAVIDAQPKPKTTGEA